MNPKEFENVVSLIPFDRYKYFIKKVADFEELWTIVNDAGNYALSEIDGNVMIPFWPKYEFVIPNLEKGWEECQPKKLTLENLEEHIFDLISDNNYLINIFPVNGKSGFIVSLEEFARDLSDELKNYW